MAPLLLEPWGKSLTTTFLTFCGKAQSLGYRIHLCENTDNPLPLLTEAVPKKQIKIAGIMVMEGNKRKTGCIFL